jgi:hypothetical protein
MRNSPFAIRPAHARYLEAAADWRVRLAWELDPGDAGLYEIAHNTMLAHAASPEAGWVATERLAEQAMEHALSPRSGLAEALTGAGAAINLLNNQLQPGRVAGAAPASLLREWDLLDVCLLRYRELREQAADEGWWCGIPPVRQEEIESYAALLVKIAGTVRLQLCAEGVLKSERCD